MPVLGHGFVALATHEALRPRLPSRRSTLVTLAVLAYLPDIASQGGRLVSAGAAGLWSHSVVVGTAASLLLTPLVARLLGIGALPALAVGFFSITMHDLLDLMQASDRRPLWPLSSLRVGPEHPWIPSGLVTEAIVFGGIFWGMWIWRRLRSGKAGGSRQGALSGSSFAAAMIVLAAITSHLRDRREIDAAAAHYRVEHGDPRGALALLDRAERWPAAAKPGRIDYLRGAAYNAVGDRNAAEHFYLLSLREDPLYYWAVVDLAVLYSEARGPSEERRRKAAPYVERLSKDFANEPSVGATLARIERKLAADGSGEPRPEPGEVMEPPRR